MATITLATTKPDCVVKKKADWIAGLGNSMGEGKLNFAFALMSLNFASKRSVVYERRRRRNPA